MSAARDALRQRLDGGRAGDGVGKAGVETGATILPLSTKFVGLRSCVMQAREAPYRPVKPWQENFPEGFAATAFAGSAL